MSEIIETTGRTATTIAAEIRFLDRQAASTCLNYIIEIGRRLVEAKSLVEDGQWLNYIKTELNYEKSTAQNYMRLYERYGTGQRSLFGSFTETETFGNLTYTKALALLQVPEEDLEEFAQGHDIENMSTRELKQAIRERDAAISEKNAAIVTRDAAIESRDESLKEVVKLHEKVKHKDELVAQLTAEMKEAAHELEAKDKEVAKLRDEARTAREKEADAKIALQKAKANPDIPEAMMAQLRGEAEAAAMEKAAAEARKKLEVAAQEKEAAMEELCQAQQRLEAAQREAKLQNPDTAVFKSLFDQVQTDFDRLHETLMKVQQGDPAMGQKLHNATVALLDKLRRDIGG